jgi:2'-5' RNA ligase
MSEGQWRCFWAVPLPDELRLRLADAIAVLRADPTVDAEWRWADPAAWHVTLAFLGSVPSDSIPSLHESVAASLDGVEPFSVATGGLGGFPSGRHPRVLWYGVGDPDHRLRSLARDVRAGSGLAEAGPFRAHVTLARSRDRRGAGALATSAHDMPDGSIAVSGVTLFRSHLGGGPARYEVLGQVPLGAPVAAAAR